VSHQSVANWVRGWQVNEEPPFDLEGQLGCAGVGRSIHNPPTLPSLRPIDILSCSHCLCVNYNWSTPPTPDAFQNSVPTVDCHVFLPPPLTVSTCSENGTGRNGRLVSWTSDKKKRNETAPMITGTLAIQQNTRKTSDVKAGQ
jgi:hypothetical protein